jgi:hypothetical protein
MKRRIMVIAALATPLYVRAGDMPTLCDAEEVVYLSCSMGKKLLFICGSKQLTKESGYLRYLFGESGKDPELVYPGEQTHPSKAFRRNEPLSSAKAGAMALAFDISSFTYNVFSTRSAFGYNGAGVIVRQGDKEVAFKECASGKVNDKKFFFDLSEIGIPVGSVHYVGPEQ